MDTLVKMIVKKNPMQKGFLQSALTHLTESERVQLEDYIAFCDGQGIPLDYLADSYNLLVNDTRREQMFFARHKRYRYSTFAEVAGSVYLNPAYMDKYMHGLALSGFMWPNHLHMNRFFERIPTPEPAEHYLEIGPGHGVHFGHVLKQNRFKQYTGIDLSPTSIDLTRRILTHKELVDPDRANLICANFLSTGLPLAHYQLIVMGEVLEHVEDPRAFLLRIRELLAPAGYAFITTVINAATVDHIALFRRPEEIRALIATSGMRVHEELLLPYHGKTVAESLEQSLPMNIALLLRHAGDS